MKKEIIKKYNPVIYPRMFWVAQDIEDVKKEFTYKDDYNIIIPNDWINGAAAMVLDTVVCKETRELGVMIVINYPKEITTKIIAHESVHVASKIFDDLSMAFGFTGGKDEHFAYLAGWAAECIEKSL